ncbi:MAG: hypothetical protein ACLFVJ_08950 [Persicimonas sp.]
MKAVVGQQHGWRWMIGLLLAAVAGTCILGAYSYASNLDRAGIFGTSGQAEPIVDVDCASLEGPGEHWRELRVTVDAAAGAHRRIGTSTLRVEPIDRDEQTLRWHSDLGVDAVVIETSRGKSLRRFDAERFAQTHRFDPADEPQSLTFCYDFELSVNMDANAEVVREHRWSIQESVDPAHLELEPGAKGTSTYRIKVRKHDGVDSEWRVHGKITVDNLTPHDAVIEDVVDNSAQAVAASLDCEAELGDYVLEAGESLTCSYSVDFPNADPRDVEVAVITRGEVSGAQSSASVDFSRAQIRPRDDSVEVADGRGQIWSFEESGSSIYRRVFTCDQDAGLHSSAARILGTDLNDTTTVTVDCHPNSDDPTASHR